MYISFYSFIKTNHSKRTVVGLNFVADTFRRSGHLLQRCSSHSCDVYLSVVLPRCMWKRISTSYHIINIKRHLARPYILWNPSRRWRTLIHVRSSFLSSSDAINGDFCASTEPTAAPHSRKIHSSLQCRASVSNSLYECDRGQQFQNVALNQKERAIFHHVQIWAAALW